MRLSHGLTIVAGALAYPAYMFARGFCQGFSNGAVRAALETDVGQQATEACRMHILLGKSHRTMVIFKVPRLPGVVWQAVWMDGIGFASQSGWAITRDQAYRNVCRSAPGGHDWSQPTTITYQRGDTNEPRDIR